MKRVFITWLLCLLAASAIAQSSFKFQIGYSIPTESAKINSTNELDYGPTGSYGAGMRFELGFLQTLSDLIDVELSAAYLSGKKVETGGGSSFTYFPTGFTNSWQFSPLVRFKIINSGKFKPYFGIGPVAAFGKIYYENVKTEINSSTTYSNDIRKEDTYSFDIGFKGVIGLRYGLGKVNAFFELGLLGLSVSPDESEFTAFSATSNGYPIYTPSDFPENERTTVYKENIGPVNVIYTPYGQSYSNNERLRYYSPLSSLTVSAGIIYELSFKKSD